MLQSISRALALWSLLIAASLVGRAAIDYIAALFFVLR